MDDALESIKNPNSCWWKSNQSNQDVYLLWCFSNEWLQATWLHQPNISPWKPMFLFQCPVYFGISFHWLDWIDASERTSRASILAVKSWLFMFFSPGWGLPLSRNWKWRGGGDQSARCTGGKILQWGGWERCWRFKELSTCQPATYITNNVKQYLFAFDHIAYQLFLYVV